MAAETVNREPHGTGTYSTGTRRVPKIINKIGVSIIVKHPPSFQIISKRFINHCNQGQEI
jgi:hypothetical protein